MYISRNIEKTINRISKRHKVLLLTGVRQVGKTTVLKHLSDLQKHTYVTLEDLSIRDLAFSDPGLFLQRYTPPVFIDEIQYAPHLLKYIKDYIDGAENVESIWIAGSQHFPLIHDTKEILGEYVGILNLQALSLNEICKLNYQNPFIPTLEELFNRINYFPKKSLKEIYQFIWHGSMPSLYNDSNTEWKNYYASYVQTILNFDIMKILQINDEMVFFRFLSAAATQTGKLINYAELAKAAEISAPTAKQWVKLLEAVGIIYLLQPFIPAGAKYVVKAPKLYFFDTGLAAYLTSWNNPEALEMGAMSNQFFETMIISEIYKSYTNNGINPPLYYIRNFNGKEIELIIYENDIMYPIGIKKSTYPNKDIKTFAIIEPISNDANIKIGSGGIICLTDELLPASDNLYYIPAWLL